MGQTESELRQQLREAWQRIADLEWQLQSAQQNSQRQDRRIASQQTALADSEEEHEQQLPDRDQLIADLEDEHQSLVDGRDAREQNGAERSAVGVEVLSELLQGWAQQSHNEDVRAELLRWRSRARVVFGVEAHMDRQSATAPDLNAILRRSLSAEKGASGGSCVIDTDLRNGGSRRQTLLLALLLRDWRMLVADAYPQPDAPSACFSIRAVADRPELRVRLPRPGVSSQTVLRLVEPLEPLVTALRARVEQDSDGGVALTFGVGASEAIVAATADLK